MNKVECRGKGMKITWLGQAGLLFEADGLSVMIDPYLSDSCHKVNPKSYRRFPVDPCVFSLQPDVIILTHNHLDHTDPETLDRFLTEKAPVTVLASGNAWASVRQRGGAHNYVLFDCGTEWTVGGITFRAVYAAHSDDHAIGVVFVYDGITYYVTGDTLYSKRVLDSLPTSIDAVFLPINGKGNNMNAVDAARFACAIGAKVAVPLHFGLFDDMDGSELVCSQSIVPKPFEEILLPL